MTTPYRSGSPEGRAGLASLVRAEWTKFRTVRGWVLGLVAVTLVTVLVSVLASSGSVPGRGSGGPPVGPDGAAVTDAFSFVNQPLDGDGTITARVTSLTSTIRSGPRPAGDGGDGEDDGAADEGPGDEGSPWAKAGLIVKASTDPGSAYAAILVTPGNGVRMQSGYTRDTAGSPAAVSEGSPVWLRLTRSGDTVTGSESTDGATWTEVGTATLAGLPSTVPAGMFVTSPEHLETEQHLGTISSTGEPTRATATFDRVDLEGGWLQGGWPEGGSTEGVWDLDEMGRSGGGGAPLPPERLDEDGGTFTVSGSGDIAPAVGGPDPNTIESSLVGTFIGLIAVIVLAASFITTEYRRGLIRTTLAASPRRGRVLAAKALVIGCVTFVTGLAAAAVSFLLVGRIRGDTILTVSWLTELRVVGGTAALVALVAVLALAVGTVLRRGAGAVTAVIVAVVLPYILAVASVLPAGAAQWLLRVTPAAGFAIQQSIPEHSQVAGTYTPATGYYPLAPWVGFAVLCAWTVLALGLAAMVLRRRDA